MSLFELPEEILALDDDESETAVVVVNTEGVVVLANRAAGELWQMSVEDMVGEYQEMLLPKDRRWGHNAYRRGYMAEPRGREMDPGLHPHLLRSDGVEVPIHVWLEPHGEAGDLYVEARITPIDAENVPPPE
jgi:PAS domain S-box-containing protein